MLLISRKIGEQLVIGDTIVVQVLSAGPKRVKLGVEAPRVVSVRRRELLQTEPPLKAPLSRARRPSLLSATY